MKPTQKNLHVKILMALAALGFAAGPALAKPYACGKTCKQEDDCEVCTILLCEKRRQKDGTLGDTIVGRKTETACEVPAAAASSVSAQHQLQRSDSAPAGSGANRAANITKGSASMKAESVASPTVDGRFSTATKGYDAVLAPTDRFTVRPGSVNVPRRFASWDSFAAFAEKNLQATVYRDASGNVAAVGGHYEWASGDVPARKDSPGEMPDIMASILGGPEQRLIIGQQQISFAPAGNDTTSFSPFSTTRENCVGRHCVEGKSWVTHLVFYHSVGTRTRQTSGGTDIVPRPCCTSGELVRENGEQQCRGRRPGAWEYDQQLGRLMPTGPNPYVFTPARTCNREALNNQLRLRGAFINEDSVQPVVITKVELNTREVEIGDWLLSLGLDTTPYTIHHIGAVCGTHASNRGESVTTTEGHTGDADELCRF
jgi:hypothetical protein